MKKYILIPLGAVFLAGCAGQSESSKTKAVFAPPVEKIGGQKSGVSSEKTAKPPAAPVSEEVVEAAPPRPLPPPPTASSKNISQANKLTAKARQAYHRGDYETAERLVKESMVIFPFLAAANVIMGKILLIKGSATHDQHLVDSARLMFEMARAIDPDAREAEILLGLFTHENPE